MVRSFVCSVPFSGCGLLLQPNDMQCRVVSSIVIDDGIDFVPISLTRYQLFYSVTV